MSVLKKLDILSMGRLKTTTITVDGGDIIISELAAADSYSLFADKANQDDSGNLQMSTFGPALVARCVVDDEGQRLFADEEAGQLARLRPELFGPLLVACMDINGLSGAAQDEAIKN